MCRVLSIKTCDTNLNRAGVVNSSTAEYTFTSAHVERYGTIFPSTEIHRYPIFERSQLTNGVFYLSKDALLETQDIQHAQEGKFTLCKYRPNGRLQVKEEFNDGVLQRVQHFDKSGLRIRDGVLNDDGRYFVTNWYKKTGTLCSMYHTLPDRCTMVGNHVEYYDLPQQVTKLEQTYSDTGILLSNEEYTEHNMFKKSDHYDEEGNLHGQQSVYEDDKLKSTKMYVHGKPCGKFFEYEDGNVICKSFYTDDGVLHGDYMVTDESGVTTGKYKNGSKVGRWKMVTLDGVTVYEGCYSSATGMPCGTHTWWSKDGKRIRSKIYTINGNSFTETTYHSNGERHIVLEYLNDKICMKRVYIPTGVLEKRANFCNGKKHGKTDAYDLNGRCLKTVKYHYGKKHGRYIKLYSCDTPAVIANYVYGKLDGMYTQYSQTDGDVVKQVKYKNGLTTGSSFSVENGVTYLHTYVQGHLHGMSIVKKAGSILSTVNYMAGIRHGNETIYNGGQVAEIREWVNGKKGKVTIYENEKSFRLFDGPTGCQSPADM